MTQKRRSGTRDPECPPTLRRIIGVILVAIVLIIVLLSSQWRTAPRSVSGLSIATVLVLALSIGRFRKTLT